MFREIPSGKSRFGDILVHLTRFHGVTKIIRLGSKKFMINSWIFSDDFLFCATVDGSNSKQPSGMVKNL